MLADSQIHRQTTALPKLRPKALYKCDYYYYHYYYSRLLITISVPVQGADYNHQTVTDSERPGGAAVLSAVLRQRRRFIGATTTTTDYLAHSASGCMCTQATAVMRPAGRRLKDAINVMAVSGHRRIRRSAT